MKKYFSILSLFVVAALAVTSCTKDEPQKSNLNSITKFEIDFENVDNKDVKYDLGNEIKISVPFGTKLTGLKPKIEVSDKATVSPASGTSVDFKDGVAKPFTVTAEDGITKKVYNVTISVRGEVGSGSQLAKFIYDESKFSGIKETYDFSYNDAKLVSSYVQTVGEKTNTFTLKYNKKNQVTGISSDKKEVTFSYNDKGQITGQEDVIDGKSRFKYVYTYGDNGYLKEVVRTDLDEKDATKAKFTSSFVVQGGNIVKETKGNQEFTATFDDKKNPFVGIYPEAYGRILAGNGLFSVNKNNTLTRTGTDDPGVKYKYNTDGYPTSASFSVFGIPIEGSYSYK